MKNYLSEFIGTFTLVFFGTGAVIVNEQTGGSLGLIGISAVFGIVVTALIYVFGSLSGAHINPAVTISLAIEKTLPKNQAVGYVVSQVLGGVLASSILFLLFPENESLGGTIPSGSVLQSFIVEIILSFFLLLTILGVTSKKETAHLAGLVIGAVVTGMILFAGPISGGSFNPARSIGPAVVSGNFTALWVYLLAPILGGVSAVFTWRLLSRSV